MAKRAKRRNQWKKAAALFLAAALTFGAAGTVLGGQRGTPYSQRPYEEIDLSKLEELTAQLEEACQPVSPEQPVRETTSIEAYIQVLEELDYIATQMALSDIRYSADLENEQRASRYEQDARQAQEAVEMTLASLQKALAAPDSSGLKTFMGDDLTQAVQSYEPASQELTRLMDEELELMMEYNRRASQSFTVEVEGKEWDYESLQEADLDGEEYYHIYMALERENNRRLGEIYLRLVQVRAEIAGENGFDSYSDYAYQMLYSRDFTPEDTKKLYEPAKESALLLLEDCWYAQSQDVSEAISQDSEALLDTVQRYVRDMDPQLGEAFSYMRGMELYDIGADGENGSRSGSFTIELPYDGDAFVFLTRENGFQDFFSLTHEFGHFAAALEEEVPWLYRPNCVDVCEIQSQGLELLMLHYKEELFGDLAEDAQLQNLGNTMDSIVAGALLDEFETTVYENPDLTLEEMNQLFGDLNAQYDQWYFVNDEDGQCFSWVDIGHLYHQPLYYIGYAASAYPAMQLWLKSQTDWQGAVNCYMELSAMGVSYPYQAALDECGLENIFKEGALEEMTERVGAALKLDSYGLEEGAEDINAAKSQEMAGSVNALIQTLILGTAAILELLVACFAIGAVILWKKR